MLCCTCKQTCAVTCVNIPLPFYLGPDIPVPILQQYPFADIMSHSHAGGTGREGDPGSASSAGSTDLHATVVESSSTSRSLSGRPSDSTRAQGLTDPADAQWPHRRRVSWDASPAFTSDALQIAMSPPGAASCRMLCWHAAEPGPTTHSLEEFVHWRLSRPDQHILGTSERQALQRCLYAEGKARGFAPVTATTQHPSRHQLVAISTDQNADVQGPSREAHASDSRQWT